MHRLWDLNLRNLFDIFILFNTNVNLPKECNAELTMSLLSAILFIFFNNTPLLSVFLAGKDWFSFRNADEYGCGKYADCGDSDIVLGVRLPTTCGYVRFSPSSATSEKGNKYLAVVKTELFGEAEK